MKRSLIGVVSSNKMQKTVVVKVERMIEHPRYKKTIKRFSKFYAHTEIPLNVGDIVEIEETRPLSKLKRWRVRRIVKRFEEESMEVEDDKTI
ncbi:MAG: 30S ribosomal protein S17 [Caldisericia bacterium]|nr:30S ribosomal protein S17 [Caldisericia bacterium]